MKGLFLDVGIDKIDAVYFSKNKLLENITYKDDEKNNIDAVFEDKEIDVIIFKDKESLEFFSKINLKLNKTYNYVILEEVAFKCTGEKIELKEKDSIFCITLINFIEINFEYNFNEEKLNNKIYLNKENILAFKNILVTGKIRSFTRGEIFQKIRGLKGNPCGSYSDNVDILVKGNVNHRTNKLRCVEEANLKGKNIIILNEEEFKEILLNNEGVF
ncbi:hypothetical protein [uncultured Clostridium sp.]|uniref:hypothetical protein n=1 Tax=uncultured Clostridium sp. TaxID=59620 RepID=UPI002626E545|nr:hypothetical protein [uncultured Clostridium sp.]